MNIKSVKSRIKGNSTVLEIEVPVTQSGELAEMLDDFHVCPNADYELRIRKVPKEASRNLVVLGWTLTDRLANALHMGKPETHRMEMEKYAPPVEELVYTNGGEVAHVAYYIPMDMDEETRFDLYGYTRPTGERDMIRGELCEERVLLKSSSEMDNCELWQFVEGVINDCKDCGVYTIPRKEMELYEKAYGRG